MVASTAGDTKRRAQPHHDERFFNRAQSAAALRFIDGDSEHTEVPKAGPGFGIFFDRRMQPGDRHQAIERLLDRARQRQLFGIGVIAGLRLQATASS